MKRKLCFALVLAGFVGLVCSCVDQNYDISKLNTEITVGGDSLAIPVGETAKLKLKDIIGDASEAGLKVKDGGYYAGIADTLKLAKNLPSFGGSISFASGVAPSANISILDLSAAAPYLSTMDSSTEYDLATYLGMGITNPVDIDKNVDVTFSVELPEGVKDVSSVQFAPGSKITIEMEVPNCPLTKGVINPNVTIDLTSMLNIPGNTGIVSLSSLVLTDDNNYKASMDIPVTSLVINGTDYNPIAHKIDIDRDITIAGYAEVSGPKTTKAALTASQKVDINVKVKFDALVVNKIQAKVDYSLSQSSMSMDLGNISGMFGDGFNVVMDLHNPSIQFDLITNLGIPASAKATLVPYKNGSPVNSAKIDVNLAVEGVTDATQTQTTKFFIAKYDEGRPAGCAFVQANIPDMIKAMPDSVVINFDIKTDATKVATIQPTASYVFDAAYDVQVPLAFGADFSLSMKDTLAADGVGKYLAMAESIAILGSVENSLPLTLDLTVKFLDSLGMVVPTKAPLGQTIQSGSATGAATKSPMNILVQFTDKTKAEKIADVIMEFAITGGANRTVSPDDYVKAQLTLGLYGGFTMDIGGLFAEEDETNK